MEAGRLIDPADDYEAAAQSVALRFGRPVGADLIRGLLGVQAHVLDDIEANPHEWARRVNEYTYGAAMDRRA